MFSGTCGSASTALAGSRYGTGGISTRPAPSRPRADLPLARREPLSPEVRWLPADPEPVRAGRSGAERAGAGPPDADTVAGASAGAGASPQTVQ